MAVKVCQRKDKPGWWVIAHYKGQRMKKAFGKDRKAAQDYAHAVRAQMAYAAVHGEAAVLGEPETRSSTTIKEYLTEWLDVYAKIHCKPSTYRGYKRSVENHLIPAFGHFALKALKRDAVKRFVARQSEEVVVRTKKNPVQSLPAEEAQEPLKTSKRKARWTVMGYLVPLKAAYNQAMEDGLASMNPVARLGRLLRGRGDRKEHIEPLTAQEVASLLHIAEERYPTLSPVILCAVRTGMRLGELIGLQWSDVDFHGGFLEVRRAIVLGEETVTKNHKIRRIDMSPQLQERLHQMKEIRDLEAMNQNQRGLWVFRSPEGQRWEERNLRRGWYRLLEAAGLRRVRFHDLRHTYASLMAAQGAPPKYVQEQLGHSSIQVTMDIYSHLFPNGNRDWVARLDELGAERKHAPPAHPPVDSAEQRSHKSLKDLVAVTRIERVTRGL